MLENINFSKIMAILASILAISLGLCGVTWMASSASGGSGPAQFWIGLGMLELLAIVLSFLGLVLTAILWIIASVVNSFGGGNDPQKLLDGSDLDGSDDEKK